MTATLFLGLALALAQPDQPRPLPIPADAPKGMPPSLIYVTVSEGTIQMLSMQYVQKTAVKKVEEKTGDGTIVIRDVAYTYTEALPVISAMTEAMIKVKDLEGKAVAYADAAKKFKGGTIALVSYNSGVKLDPQYLKAVKDGTLVLEIVPQAIKEMPKPQVPKEFPKSKS